MEKVSTLLVTPLLITENIEANSAENNPTIIPVLNLVSKWNINSIPIKLSAPIKISRHLMLTFLAKGSMREVNMLVLEKQTSAIDTLANLILP